jgi:hypothetical protein
MPAPDWERADQFRQADQPGADRGLANRLSRLPSSHPSAWPAPDRVGAKYRERDREEWWRPAADTESPETEPDDTEPDDTEPDDAGLVQESADEPETVPPGDDADLEDVAGVPVDAIRPAAPAGGERRSEASAGWGELGGMPAPSPYRPWFNAEGAADPWFAVRKTE